MNISYFFYYLSILTISFDIFLVIEIGFNIRISQIFLFISFFFYILGWLLKPKVIRVPLGFFYLLIWSLFILVFIPNTGFISRSIGYGFWLVFSNVLIFITVQMFDTKEKVIDLVRIYLISFAIISFFGILQFLLGIFGISVLVEQWWLPGVFPRVNGFSYEPSYFATYLIMGWCLSAYFLEKNIFLISKFYLKMSLFLMTTAMILSSSRMGIMIMALWLLKFPIVSFVKFLNGKYPRKYLKVTLCVSISLFALIFVVFSYFDFDDIKLVFSGVGIGGTSDYSVSARSSEAQDTIAIFLKSPIIGYSLGGITYAIGQLRGIDVTSFDLAKENEGMSVFLEVLAASGIFGFIPFCIYIVQLIYKPIKLARLRLDFFSKGLLMGLVLSFVFELLILQLNQTILRPYLWLHIAILSATYSVFNGEEGV